MKEYKLESIQYRVIGEHNTHYIVTLTEWELNLALLKREKNIFPEVIKIEDIWFNFEGKARAWV